MLQTIKTQIDNINSSLNWIKENHPDDYDQKFITLIDERRKLRRIEKAASEKPAIAAYGESQKGKSYLMGNLLQNNGAPFMVKVKDGTEEVNFVQSINPIGDKKEATGVVTRFTTFEDGSTRYSQRYPVIVKLLSPTAIATILCDGYHKDIMDYEIYSDEELKKFANRIFEKYSKRPEIENPVITEDDVLEIKSYLSKYLTETQNLRRSEYFEALAKVIRRVPVDEWVDVFGYLWHEDEVVSNIFSRLVRVLRTLNFVPEVYTDVETVRHYGDNTNTIMSVDCLNGLDDPTWDRTATVFIKGANGTFTPVKDLKKCELAAVCAETIYKVEEVYANDEVQYNYYPQENDGDLPGSSFNALPNRSVKKSLLSYSDLLDFPGARNRLKVRRGFLANFNQQIGSSNAVQMLLRGKVAYLFNSYSESRIINILLFCHDAEAIVVNEMYIMLNDWVEKYVGKTPEERAEMIEKCGGVSPLFNICTKFNIDMIENENAEKNSLAALNQRWTGRLIKVLFTQAFKAGDVNWFCNWDGTSGGGTGDEKYSHYFRNSYLLRDYKYSGCTGSGNNLWDGYIETDPQPSEKVMRLNPDFYSQLRESFVENDDVKKFFTDRALAWDVAATRNNDGSLYIIDRLNTVARHASEARNELFRKEIGAVKRNVRKSIEDYYVSTDAGEILDKNIKKAKSIFRELDFTCNTDNYFFGHLLQSLQMTEQQSYTMVHAIMQSPELNESVNAFKDYEIIRNSCKKAGYPLEDAKTDREKWDCLINTYGFTDKEEAAEYIRAKGIEESKLFSGSYKRKLNSCIVADSVFEKWTAKIKSAEFLNRLAGDDGFDTVIMNTLVDTIVTTAQNIGLPDIMADAIAEYVNVVNVHTANEYLLSDILADIINDFVLDFGFSLLPEDQQKKAKKLCADHKLVNLDYIDHEEKGVCDEDELTRLFNEMSENPKALLPSFENNYNKWIEYMFLSFVVNLNVPDFDREANDKLKRLLDSMKI